MLALPKYEPSVLFEVVGCNKLVVKIVDTVGHFKNYGQ